DRPQPARRDPGHRLDHPGRLSLTLLHSLDLRLQNAPHRSDARLTVAPRLCEICAFGAPARGLRGCALDRAPDLPQALRSRGGRPAPGGEAPPLPFVGEPPPAANKRTMVVFQNLHVSPYVVEGRGSIVGFSP